MQHREIESPNELRDAIQGFWYTSIDFGKQPSNFEILPDGYAEIIFLFGSTCSVSVNGDLQPLPSPFLMGLLGQPVILHAQNLVKVIGIKCFPWTVNELLGLSSSQGGVRIFEHPIAQLQATLNGMIDAGAIDEALTEVKQYFLNVRAGISTNGMLSKAGSAMRKTNGTMPVSQVASAAHATVRTLERNFKQSSGYTVKDVSGLMRFEQVRNHLLCYPDTKLTSLAQQLGYADQAHLSREFKRYSGTTPAAFARKAKNGEHPIASNYVAFVQV
ncbi:AraC family transcriptional regulator [Mucilaginibacter sp. Bleaf8]|uniref:helix-turn-helix domain-containing protein n=1 Tax=Mucilaginibacter sp. Bleaf8 TaxID=2834430 RepID=UPI001BCDC913|nr:helix-turn-helix domain-containing protein [Mucilaginibacter sp. Bleaf8]MBS7564257.1 AraC family transcriptional regulator [Mucilaginibacter sp. Bleaf8]